MDRRRDLIAFLLPAVLVFQIVSTDAFAIVPITSAGLTAAPIAASTSFQDIHDPRLLPDLSSSSLAASYQALSSFQETSPSLSLSAVTVDPTSFLNDLFAGVSGSPELLLAVPILAALGLVSVLAYAIISYANPAEPDD